MQVYINGSFIPRDEAMISAADRGFLFGDGIYEVIRVVEGRFVLADEHLARMDEGLRELSIQLSSDIRNDILNIGKELIHRNDLTEGQASVYIQITRGAAWPRTHTYPDPKVQPTFYLSAARFKPHTELHKKGVDAITVPDVRWARCNLKTVNLLPNSMAKQRAAESGVNSAVMIRDGVITESPNANIFGVKNGVLQTYPATNYILNGITRQAVLKIAEELNIPVKLEPVNESELFKLDELFFTGTTTDIQPVVNIDGKKIGTGKPGEICRMIQKRYDDLLAGR